MQVYSAILLGVYQLCIHIMSLIIIEILLFYLIIKVKSEESLKSYMEGININHILQKSSPGASHLVPTIDLSNTKKYVDNYIFHNNKYVLMIILFIILSIITIMLILYTVTGKFDYNLRTTIGSLIISTPIQLVYIYEYNIKSNPRLNLFMMKQMKEKMIHFIDTI